MHVRENIVLIEAKILEVRLNELNWFNQIPKMEIWFQKQFMLSLKSEINICWFYNRNLTHVSKYSITL